MNTRSKPNNVNHINKRSKPNQLNNLDQRNKIDKLNKRINVITQNKVNTRNTSNKFDIVLMRVMLSFLSNVISVFRLFSFF